MNKNVALKKNNLDADLAIVDAKINQYLESKSMAKRELDRLKFTQTTHSAWAKCGGQFPANGFTI